MKPTIGRIVHYVAADGLQPYQHYAAVITHVWSDTCVNLFVFPKGSPKDADDADDTGVKTSVVVTPEGGVMQSYSWHWPERE